MGRWPDCWCGIGIIIFANAIAAGADSDDKRATEAEIGKLRGQVTLLIKQLPASYRYAPRDAAATPPAAVTELRALDNPLLLDAIAAMFPREKRPEIRALYVELYSQIKPAKAGFLVRTGISEPERMVRNLARSTWEELDPVEVVANSFRYLGDDKMMYPALDALNDSGVLDRLTGEPGPLLAASIESLIKRLYRADKSLVAVDSVRTAQNATAARRVQRRDAAVVTKPVPDPVVHSVLTRITKEDFGYDLEKWDRWYAIKFR